eukprot:TRINITY_DN11519_c0_g1_i1.p1 TRINITY_DN11519_c0_g1~~TRINITY_DN11519_c0_g1_i1.p1  ORF type:complete len:318 (-),score=34.54 TRINITY_DN11519_c0_g1_i1:45-998(-)
MNRLLVSLLLLAAWRAGATVTADCEVVTHQIGGSDLDTPVFKQVCGISVLPGGDLAVLDSNFMAGNQLHVVNRAGAVIRSWPLNDCYDFLNIATTPTGTLLVLARPPAGACLAAHCSQLFPTVFEYTEYGEFVRSIRPPAIFVPGFAVHNGHVYIAGATDGVWAFSVNESFGAEFDGPIPTRIVDGYVGDVSIDGQGRLCLLRLDSIDIVLPNGTIVRRMPASTSHFEEDFVVKVAVSPDGLLAAASFKSGAVRVWSTETGSVVRSFGLDGYGTRPAPLVPPDFLDPHLRAVTFMDDSLVCSSPDGHRVLWLSLEGL